MTDEPKKPENEKALPLITSNLLNSMNKREGIVPFWRKAFLLIPLLLIVLSGAALLTFKALNRNRVPAHTAISSNSNGAMFGFDLQRTHFNSAERILNVANVSRLVVSWSLSTGNVIISSPTVANGIV